MAIKTVYNRDGSIYGELDTDKYLFNNTLIGSEPVKLDVELYPYVKVAGVYYKNDGEEWFTKSRANDSAGLMNKTSSFLSNGVDFLKNVTDFMKYRDSLESPFIEVHEGYKEYKQYSIPYYKIDSYNLNGWGNPKDTTTEKKFTFGNEIFYWYGNSNTQPKEFLLRSVSPSYPWVLSNYFSYTKDVVKDVFSTGSSYTHTNAGTGTSYELLLSDSQRVIMYKRSPGTISCSATRPSATITYGEGTAKMVYSGTCEISPIVSNPICTMYDLTQLVKERKSFTIYGSNFNPPKLASSDAYYPVFNSLWKPIIYDFAPELPSVPILGGSLKKNITTGNVTVTVADKTIYTLWIPTSQYDKLRTYQITGKAIYEYYLNLNNTAYSYRSFYAINYTKAIDENGVQGAFPFRDGATFYGCDPTIAVESGLSKTISSDSGLKQDSVSKHYNRTYNIKVSRSYTNYKTYSVTSTSAWGIQANDPVYGVDTSNYQYAIVVWDESKFSPDEYKGIRIEAKNDGWNLLIMITNNTSTSITAYLRRKAGGTALDSATIKAWGGHPFKIANISDIIDNYAPNSLLEINCGSKTIQYSLEELNNLKEAVWERV